MALSRLPPQSYKPAFDVRIHVLPAHQLIIPHLIHAQGIPFHSFVFNFQAMITVQMSYGYRPAVDITGTPRTIGAHTDTLMSNGGIGDATRGIVVGAGMTPPTVEDYKLGAKYLHGITAGKLSYGTNSFVTPYNVGDITYSALARTISNLSGGPVTIYEIGWDTISSLGSGFQFLVARDLLLSPLTLANGQAKQFIYTLATQV